MAYCNNCKVRAVYQNGLCYECNQKIGKRKSLPHGSISYNKYNPEMSKTIEPIEPKSVVQDKKRKPKTEKTEKPSIIGAQLQCKNCAGYGLYMWKHPSEKPTWDENKIEYYYIVAKPYSKSKKIQVRVDHEAKKVYLSAVKLTKAYTQAASREILRIIREC